MKRIIKAVLALGFGLGLSMNVRAAVSDALTVTITPNAYYAVAIDTTNVSLNLGTVALAASTQTVSPSTVTVQSTYATTDLKLQGSIASGGTAWTFDDNTATQEANKIASWATFTSIARSSAPTQTGDYFEGTTDAAASDVVSANNRYIGTSATDGADRFENESGFDLVDTDGQAPSAQTHLWLYFRLPSNTSTNNAQNITITLTAVATN